MEHLPLQQRRLLETLRRHAQGASLDQLAEALGVTRTAAKAHLLKLLDLGYAAFEDERGGVGRPRRRYLISSAGLEVFPRQYSWLSNTLLTELAAEKGVRGLAGFMKKLGAKVAASMRTEFQGGSPAQRVKEVTRALNSLGYHAAMKGGGAGKALAIEAVNCVYHTVALQHPELCQFDVEFIQTASGMPVELESCIAKGGACCRFRLGPGPKA